MKILLKIMGQKLYHRITKAIAAADSPFPRSGAQSKLTHWQLIQLEPPFNSVYLESQPEEMPIVLMEISDAAAIEQLRTMEQRESLHVRSVFSTANDIAPRKTSGRPSSCLHMS